MRRKHIDAYRTHITPFFFSLVAYYFRNCIVRFVMDAVMVNETILLNTQPLVLITNFYNNNHSNLD